MILSSIAFVYFLFSSSSVRLQQWLWEGLSAFIPGRDLALQ
jgi:hypothetical protein